MNERNLQNINSVSGVLALSQSEKDRPRKYSIYNEFILWSAMPEMERRNLGIETQTQFCEYYKIGINTPTKWKERPDFYDRVRKIMRLWAFDKTPTVIHGIYRSAVKGNSDSQRIWLQYFEGWTEKQTMEHVVKVQMSPNDIRFLIDGMPEEYKRKYYGYIREIIDTAVSLRNAGQLQDGYAEDPAIEGDVSGEADNDAPNVPDNPTSKVSTSYPRSIRTDMVWEVQSHHHQSPERWR